MFLKKAETPAGEAKPEEKPEEKKEEKPIAQMPEVLPGRDARPATLDSLKELLEKNLKWSQIIYEQNRHLNGKLLWSAVANWLRLIIIVVPIVLALIYLPPIISSVWSQYGDLLGSSQTGKKPNEATLNNLFKSLNIDPAKQEQIKALLK